MKEIFELPEAWYVKVTKSNRKILSDWRYENTTTGSNLLDLHYLTGIHKNSRGYFEKGHNPVDIVEEEGYTFGIEITTAQFKKYVLKPQLPKPKSSKDYNYLLPLLKKLNLK
jgi:hypothetical protein